MSDRLTDGLQELLELLKTMKMNLERETMTIVDIDMMVFLFSNQPIIGVT